MLINFSTFHASLAKPVGWRPTFKVCINTAIVILSSSCNVTPSKRNLLYLDLIHYFQKTVKVLQPEAVI